MKMNMVFAAIGLVLVGTAQAAFTDFETGLDGWTAEGSGNLSWSTAGGNPGGFARWNDVSGTRGDGWLVAPAKFLGNWSGLNNAGQLSWDHRILSTGDGATLVTPSVLIAGPGGSAKFSSGAFQQQWTSFAIPISSSSWQMTGGTWSQLLANVASLKIRIESVHNAGPGLDVNGIDNVRVTPEPWSIAMLSLTACIFRRKLHLEAIG